jgi:demethylmenaquinone methyltransferase/2-methoxy-6-polyprenyl-1,4-benzoquinol methylase
VSGGETQEKIVRAPHATLGDYYGSSERREAWVKQMFDDTAADYDRIERIMGLGSGSWYRHQALLRAGLAAGMRVLDVGTGTGLVAREAAGIAGGGNLVTGLDPSAGMLASAKLPPGIVLVEGRAESIPLAGDGFEFLSMGYALRHIADLSRAFAEFHRVLRPGGRLCILEITRPRSRVALALLKAYMRGVVPALVRLTSSRKDSPRMWAYYWDTIEACAPPEAVMNTLVQAGFTAVDRHVELGIFSEYRAIKPGS